MTLLLKIIHRPCCEQFYVGRKVVPVSKKVVPAHNKVCGLFCATVMISVFQMQFCGTVSTFSPI